MAAAAPPWPTLSVQPLQQPWRGLHFSRRSSHGRAPWEHAGAPALPLAASSHGRQPLASSGSSPWLPCSLIHGAQKNPSWLPFFFLQPAARPPLSPMAFPPASSAFSVVFNLRSLPSPCSTLSIFFLSPSRFPLLSKARALFPMAEQPPCSELLLFPSVAQLLHGETPLFLQPRHLPLLPRCQRCARATCSANCPSGVLRSEQHVGMPAGCLLFCAAPSSSSFTPVRPRRSLFDSASTLFSYD